MSREAVGWIENYGGGIKDRAKWDKGRIRQTMHAVVAVKG